jgi:hypothetical protein
MTRPEPIECIVLRTNESESKKNGLIRTVTLMVPNDGTHPFAGLVGERLHIIALNVDNDETTTPVALAGQDGETGGTAKPAPAAQRAPSEPKFVTNTPRYGEGPRRDRRKWDELLPAQQAAIRCGEPEFQAFLGARDIGDAADLLRRRCGVESRASLNTDVSAAASWRLIEDEFWAWQRDPRRSAA